MPTSPDRAFDLARSTMDHASSMSKYGEVVRGERKPFLELGDEVELQARHFGVKWRLKSRIVEYERPTIFVDEQIVGPFKYFRHEHHYIPSEFGTLATDHISFVSPLGLLGRPVSRYFLKPYLAKIISERNIYLLNRVRGEMGTH